MTEHEPSYYEIALTNRQVMVAFVILLACLMGTFFAGIWVGGGDAPASAEAARPGDDPAAPETQSIAELDFFGGGGEVAPPQDDETERRYEPPGPGETGAGQAAPAQPRREDPAVQRNRRQARAGGADGDDDTSGGEGAALSEDAPPPATMAPTRDTAPPTTSRPAARSGSEGDGGLVVQVFSSNDREQAQKVVNRLSATGQSAFLSPQEVDGRTMYRVRIGPFSDRSQAERVAAQVKRAHKLDTWITQ